jgi:hypothetical protein
VNIVHQLFLKRLAVCGDPRDRDPIQLGGPLSATRCGIGPSQSSSKTAQTATNQQVAVSGGGKAVGAVTSGAVSGKGSASVGGTGNKVKTTSVGNVSKGNAVLGNGNTAVTQGAKSTLNLTTNTSTSTVGANNSVTTSNSNNTTINNSGTSNVTNTYGDDAATIAALNAVTNQGAQSEDAIGGLADTITHAFDTVATFFTASPQTGSVGYVSTPQSNTPAAPAATYTQVVPTTTDETGGGSGLTQTEIWLIVGAVAVVGGIIFWQLSK